MDNVSRPNRSKNPSKKKTQSNEDNFPAAEESSPVQQDRYVGGSEEEDQEREIRLRAKLRELINVTLPIGDEYQDKLISIRALQKFRIATGPYPNPDSLTSDADQFDHLLLLNKDGVSATLLIVNPVPTKDAQSLLLDDMEFNFGDGAQITSFAENAQFMFFATLRGTITLVNRHLDIHQTVKIQASSIGRLGLTDYGNTLMFLSKPGQLTCLPITDENGVGLDE